MGFLDRAKKLAEQAKDMAEGALADAKTKPAPSGAAVPSSSSKPAYGTPYVPGMLGREGWRERGLVDPAAVLPIADRDRLGVPRSTKSVVVEEPFGMGRRWSSGGRSAAVFYQLYPEHQAWAPPGGTAPFAEIGGASTADLTDGRSLVFLGRHDQRVVLELTGFDGSDRADLARAVAAHLPGG